LSTDLQGRPPIFCAYRTWRRYAKQYWTAALGCVKDDSKQPSGFSDIEIDLDQASRAAGIAPLRAMRDPQWPQLLAAAKGTGGVPPISGQCT
jgi:hypothetical protein